MFMDMLILVDSVVVVACPCRSSSIERLPPVLITPTEFHTHATTNSMKLLRNYLDTFNVMKLSNDYLMARIMLMGCCVPPLLLNYFIKKNR